MFLTRCGRRARRSLDSRRAAVRRIPPECGGHGGSGCGGRERGGWAPQQDEGAPALQHGSAHGLPGLARHLPPLRRCLLFERDRTSVPFKTAPGTGACCFGGRAGSISGNQTGRGGAGREPVWR